MALVEVLFGDAKAREAVSDLVRRLGHDVVSASNLDEGVQLLSRARPQAVLASETLIDVPGEIMLRELRRVSPLVPMVVCLERRDANRAIDLMESGALECVAPPWTEESVKAILRKALRLEGTRLDLVPERPTRPAVLWVAAALLLVGAFFAGRATFRRAEGAKTAYVEDHRTGWELPYYHPSGLAYGDGRFWIGDWFSQTIYAHRPGTFEVERAVHFPLKTPVSLTFAQETLWSASSTGEIIKHMRTEKIEPIQRFDAPGVAITGIAFDGLYYWTSDTRANKINRHIPDKRFRVVETLDYPGAGPAGLVYARDSLWSVDAGAGELLRHDIADPRLVLRRIPLPMYQSGKWRPSGLTYDGKDFWTVGEKVDSGKFKGRIFRHRVP